MELDFDSFIQNHFFHLDALESARVRDNEKEQMSTSFAKNVPADSSVAFPDEFNNNITHDIETADKCADDEQDECAASSQVLTQPRDSASLEDEPFFHEEALPLAVTEQRITPASAIKHQAELLEPPLSSADMEGKYAAAKQQKLARAPRQKKTCAVAAQKNDLRKYFAVVKGQPLLQQFCSSLKPATTLSESTASNRLSPHTHNTCLPTNPNSFAGFKESGARPIDAFNGRAAARAAGCSSSSSRDSEIEKESESESDGETIRSSTQLSTATNGDVESSMASFIDQNSYISQQLDSQTLSELLKPSEVPAADAQGFQGKLTFANKIDEIAGRVVEEYTKQKELRRAVALQAHENQQQEYVLRQPCHATSTAGAKRKRIQPQLLSAATLPVSTCAVQQSNQRIALAAPPPLEVASSSSRRVESARITVLRVSGSALQVELDTLDHEHVVQNFLVALQEQRGLKPDTFKIFVDDLNITAMSSAQFAAAMRRQPRADVLLIHKM